MRRRVHTGLKTWLGSFFPNLRDAAIRWSEDDAGSLSASVAYYLALSLFPMLLLLTSAFGLVLQFTQVGVDSQNQLLETVAKHASPVIQQQVAQVLQQLKTQSFVGGPFGIVTAILAAIGVFAQLDRGFDRVWRIQSVSGQTFTRTVLGVVRGRFFAFFMLLCLGGMLFALFVAGLVFAQVQVFAGETLPSLSPLFNYMQTMFVIAANALLFGLVYKWLPKRRVRWGDALRGGLLASIVWECGRVVLGIFLIGMRYTSAYGVIGSFIAILLWCYYGMSIIFFGAEYIQVLQQRRIARARQQARLNTVPNSFDQQPIQTTQEPVSDLGRIKPAKAMAAKSSMSDKGQMTSGSRIDVGSQTNRAEDDFDVDESFDPDSDTVDYEDSPQPHQAAEKSDNGYLRTQPKESSSGEVIMPRRVL